MDNRLRIKQFFGFSVKKYLIAAAVFATACGLCFLLQNISENDFHVPLIFVMTVMIISRVTDGYFLGIVSSFAAVIAVNYIFTYPYFELDFSLTGYPLTFVIMLLVSLVTCTMTARIRQQEKVIKESEKEKIRSDLLRGISHDIRTPLTSISGAVNTLLVNKDIPMEKQQELLEDAYDNSQWLIRMVENVLTITRIGAETGIIGKNPEIVEEVISEVLDKFQKQWPEINIEVSVPEEILFVPMDATLIQQVFQNILQNSAEHGTGCTDIDISVRKRDDDAVFVFHDNGKGFDFLNKDNSFPAISRERSDDHKNMGIGLSVCRTIITAHGGTMSLGNNENGGATVTLTLPLEEK